MDPMALIHRICIAKELDEDLKQIQFHTCSLPPSFVQRRGITKGNHIIALKCFQACRYPDIAT